MANIDDAIFGKSLSAMTSEEIQDRIRENRRLRRTPVQRKKAAPKKAVKKNLSSLSKEKLLELKALLEGSNE